MNQKLYAILRYIKYKWKRLLVVALIIGPGLITAFADNDAAGVSAYSVSAATFGYRILIITIPMTILLALTQEIGARIGIVADKGLADLIREQYGVRISIAMFVLLFIVNFTVVVLDLAGVKSALALFGLPTILLPIIVGLLFLFIVRVQYKTTERFFLITIGFYLVYMVSAILSKPDWGMAVRSMILPEGPFSPKFIYTAIAVVGTTITAWGQFFINSTVKDKHLTVEHLKYNRWEVYTGAFLTDLFSFFMMVAVIATLFVHGVQITGAAEASIAIKPFAGNLAGLLFGMGLFVAGLFGCIIVPLSTSYAFSEFFGYPGSLNEDFHKSRLFYTILLIQLALGTIIVLFPAVTLFSITVIGNFFNGAVLPIIFFFLYRFVNNEKIMGKHRNTRLQNWLLVGGGVFITAASLLSIAGQVLGW